MSPANSPKHFGMLKIGHKNTRFRANIRSLREQNWPNQLTKWMKTKTFKKPEIDVTFWLNFGALELTNQLMILPWAIDLVCTTCSPHQSSKFIVHFELGNLISHFVYRSKLTNSHFINRCPTTKSNSRAPFSPFR